jgi:polar amino acid transport system substrate-binding protein
MVFGKKCLKALLLIFLLLMVGLFASQAKPQQDSLKVGISGGEPFVVNIKQQTGISLEIWQEVARMQNLNYKLIPYQSVPEALTALQNGKLNAVVGPVSITPERAKKVEFTQPYYQSSISIMSRKVSPGVFKRILTFFRLKFLLAIAGFLIILAIVGTIFWLAEREKNPEEFSHHPLYGIPDGMWCAIVTMTTTGYGDIAPRTLWGRITAGCWMVICIVFATTMVAGIASSLTASVSASKTISKVDELNGKKVAVVKNSPSATFLEKYGASEVKVEDLKAGYDSLKAKKVDAVMFDRPEMLYFLQNHKDNDVSVSHIRYMRQGYGFAMPLNANSKELHQLDISLLKLQKSGKVNRVVTEWLGQNE